MIASLSGKIISKRLDRAVVDVSGVGYQVFLTADSISRLPDNDDHVFLHIHTQVRDDAIVLYGFLDQEDREMFLMLTGVSGIGPKLALGVLSGMQASELCRAIAAGDLKLLTGLPGIGKKTAERICLDLKDKVGQVAPVEGLDQLTGLSAATEGSSSAIQDALSALANLGYSDPVCRQTLISVKKRLGDEQFHALEVEGLLRECLRALA